MNKKMKTICREISNGENLDFNLPQYLNRLITLYEQYAEITFTMQYYTFYESYLENPGKRKAEEETLLKEFNLIIKQAFLEEFSGNRMESGVSALNKIRNFIIDRMKVLTAYTDIFEVYEYVLNRIEYRFQKNTELQEEEFCTQVMRYIFDTKDNVVINDKIREVIGQLPVRLTKSRYFDLIRNSISIYKGADRSSLDGYIYMLETGSMLYHTEGMEDSYPELAAFKKELEKLDYKNMAEEEYNLYSDKLKEYSAFIRDTVDFYYSLQECVNHLYVILISSPYAYMEGGYRIERIQGELKFLLLPEDENLCKSIIKVINQYFLYETKIPLEGEVEEKLPLIEGKQEFLAEEFEALESYFSIVRTNYGDMIDSLMLGPLFRSLCLAQNLLGTSLFVNLEEREEKEKADGDYIVKVQEELITNLSILFDYHSKYVTRAVMANTLKKLPVFFESTKEVMEYVKNSLEQCQDGAEKKACINIIKSFFEN